MLLSAGGGQSCEVGKPALMALSAGLQARPSFAPPWQVFAMAQVPAPQSAFTVQAMPSCAPSPTQAWSVQIGQTWMPGRFGSRSPSRKSVEVSGRFRFDAPVLQFAVPVAFVETELTTHTLVGVLTVLGIGSGGPKRHPTLLQFRMLPVWPDVRLVSVRAPVPLLQDEMPLSVVPWSGTAYGSGTVLLPPPV